MLANASQELKYQLAEIYVLVVRLLQFDHAQMTKIGVEQDLIHALKADKYSPLQSIIKVFKTNYET